MNTIFVYGTLKRGHGNYERYIAPDIMSEFIGEAKSIDSDYAMLCYGAPMLFKDVPNGHPVKGELYEVSDEAFARIDRLEGHPRVYCRERQFFTTTDGSVYEAWVYLSSHPLNIENRYPAPLNEVGQLVWPRPKLARKPGPVQVSPNTNKMYRDLVLILNGDPIDFQDLQQEDRQSMSLQQRAAISALSSGDFTITIAEDGTTTIALDGTDDYEDEDELAAENDYDDESDDFEQENDDDE